jgi:two-component system, sensor histidine kinase YesM
MKNKLKIKTQLLLSYLVMFIVISAIIIGFISSKTLNIVLKNTEFSTLDEFNRIESNISVFQKDMQKIMFTFLLDPTIMDFCSNDYGMDYNGIEIRKKIGDYLDLIMNLNPEIASIFIETSDGNVIGTEENYNYNTDKSAKNKKEQLSDPPKVIYWEAGTVSIYDINQRKQVQEHVISLCGRFNNVYKGRYSKITINIKEKIFRSLYENINEKAVFPTYICNEKGVILTSQNQESIWTTSLFAKKITQDKQNSSFVYKNESGEKRQIVYKTINADNKWIIVKEIPLNIYLKDVNNITINIILIFIAAFIITVLFAVVFVKRITTPINLLINGMKKMKKGKIGYQIEEKYENEFGLIIDQFNEMSLGIHNLMDTNQNIEKQKRQYMITTLKAQINPHFIFNTINMIKWMAIAQHAENIRDALEMLMAIMKPVFKQKEGECTLCDEIAYTQNYLQLINLRFGGQIKLDVQISSELLNQKIPCFLFQPVIENCIEHGFYGESYNGVITITAKQEKAFEICIFDNGKGMGEEALNELRQRILDAQQQPLENGDKLGLVNVHMRIRLQYGNDYGVYINSESGFGTSVILKLPQIL